MAESTKQATATRQAPAPEVTAVPEAESNGRPQGRVVEDIPGTTRQGFWAKELEWFKENPGKIKLYEKQAQTSASYLRSTYGLDAHNRNSKNGKADLYVRYLPDKAEAIKAGSGKRGQQSGQ